MERLYLGIMGYAFQRKVICPSEFVKLLSPLSFSVTFATFGLTLTST